MLDFIKNNIRNLIKHDPKKKEELDEDYSTKISSSNNIEHLFVYKNDNLLKQNKLGNYLWYVSWSKTDNDTALKFLEFLQFTENQQLVQRTYVILENVHILLTLDTNQMSEIYDNYIKYGVSHPFTTSNVFIEALLKDISLDIPQSYIKGKLNKAIQYHRTTLDGELDDDFKQVKDTNSTFPIEVQSECYILQADSILDIRKNLDYISSSLSIFVSDEELLKFGNFVVQIKEHQFTFVLENVWDVLPNIILATELMTEDEVNDFMMKLVSTCDKNNIILIVDDQPLSDVVFPQDSNEEIIENSIVSENKERE